MPLTLFDTTMNHVRPARRQRRLRVPTVLISVASLLAAVVVAVTAEDLPAVAAGAIAPPTIAVSQPSANQYYVATTGSDTSGDGSAARPWATIGHAADAAVIGTGGAVVHVAIGTYRDLVHNTRSGEPGGAFLTFVSDVPWGAHIVTGGGLRDFPFRNDGNYVRIVGFDVTSTSAWVAILTYGTGNVIEGNHVHDINGPSCTGSPGGVGIGDDQSATGNTFASNVVHDIGSYPQTCQYIHGIYPSGAHDVVVNNVTYHVAGSGILFNHNSVGATISNNLSFANNNHGISISSGGSSGDGFVITNNIVRDNKLYGINVHSDANGPNNQYRNNLFWGNGKGRFGLDNDSTEWTDPPNTTGTVTADPHQVDYRTDGTGDYHLAPGSPAIDAGTTLDAPMRDYDAVVRPQGSNDDIGPYESGGTAPTPTTSPSPSPTVTSTPTPTPTGSAPPGLVVVSFEDGADGWSGLWGNPAPAVITSAAYDGTHALQFNRSTSGHTGVGSSRGVTGLVAGSTMTYHVRAAQDGTTVHPFVRDSHYAAYQSGPDVPLPVGQWVTLTWTVPTTANLTTVGLDASPGSGTVELDALTWRTGS